MITSTGSRSPSESSRPSSPSALEASTPPSPTTTITTTASSPTHQQLQQPSTASLDDIFGASPPLQRPLDHNVGQYHEPDREPSDLPLLRRQHVTAGYRDGISIAKGEHVQRGFDGGFPVGAELGLRVGIVLGVLEGLVSGAATAAARRRGGGNGDLKGSVTRQGGGEDMVALFETAKKELSVQNVFGAVAADVGVEAEQKGNGGQEWVDPCVRLAKAGDDVVARWERRVGELLAGPS
ncbi:hypothetical protein EMCG_04623 [[Emmonsia] crescens]|uniref:Protein YAE1 n=1 Tax=[Emmonsia] crescens TaxID=73230 RepID=A0A0G2J790_9EURO|nr:hypothetical protein EMCG_04623 [Emmonsia crescens UAMH 3008]